MPMSPPETTSLASWPTTWPSCIANSVPPMLRITWLALAIMLCSSSGACSVSTRVSESEMLVATGSASCDQSGMVAVTHSLRVISLGSVVSSATEITSSSHSAAMWNAWSSWVRCSGVVLTWPDAARSWPCLSAMSQLMPSPPRSAPCSWFISAATLAGSFGSPAAPASWLGSMEDAPDEDVAQHVLEFVFGILTLIGS